MNHHPTVHHPAGHAPASVRRGRRLRGLLALVLTAALAAGTVSAAAAPPSDDPPVAARYAARWLAAQVADDGSVAGGFSELGDAGNAALALASAGVEDAAFDRALGYVLANVEAYLAPFGTDDPGRLGRALLLAEVAGIDPSDFGGVDLPARLAATLGAFEADLYGAADPTYDGVLRQSLAVLGLVATGLTPPAAAVDWLVDQQCDAATPSSRGGWESYRADPTVACAAPDADTFAGPDSNATAYAVMALAAVGATADHDALAYLASVQAADGGWSYQGTGPGEPNSTALVIQALVASGEDPAAWGSPSPWDSLLSWVLPCGTADAGAFVSPYSDGAANVLANIDAIPAAAGVAWPLDGPVSLAGPVGDPCPGDPGTTSSTTAAPTSSTGGDGSSSTTTGVPSTTFTPATPQPLAASFTG